MDNSGRIAADALLLAFASHAASKAASTEGLYRIGTLGFRGEALSSIGSIARVVRNAGKLPAETHEFAQVKHILKTRPGAADLKQQWKLSVLLETMKRLPNRQPRAQWS